MNAPNFSFDAESRSDRRSLAVSDGSHSVTSGGSSSVTNATPEAYVQFSAHAPGDESGTDYRKYFFLCLGLVLKYRWLIIAFSGLALAIGFIQTFTATPIYQATATIQIDRQAPKLVKEVVQDRDFGGGDMRFYKTQYDLLRSRSLAERVAADLNLGAAKDFVNPPSTSPWGKLRALIFPSADTATKDNGNFEQRKNAAVGMVQGGLSVEPVTNSSLVRLSFDNPSPKWAQRIANGVADSYVTSNLD